MSNIYYCIDIIKSYAYIVSAVSDRRGHIRYRLSRELAPAEEKISERLARVSETEAESERADDDLLRGGGGIISTNIFCYAGTFIAANKTAAAHNVFNIVIFIMPSAHGRTIEPHTGIPNPRPLKRIIFRTGAVHGLSPSR